MRIKDGELQIGNHDKQHFMLRWFLPYSFCEYDRGQFRFRWLKTLNIQNWIRDRPWRHMQSWYFWFARHSFSNRCYCEVGYSFRLQITVCGFGLSFWYSNYTGPIPCICDEVIAELDANRLKAESS